MNRAAQLRLCGVLFSLSLLAGGCLFKPARVSPRYFMLAPLPPSEHAPAAEQPVPVEVEYVKMPSYLLRDYVVVRKSATEMAYLEDVLWAERLDQNFRQTLAENLSRLLGSDGMARPAPEQKQARLQVFVNVQQFDVATNGEGTLRADWRLMRPGVAAPLRMGQTGLHRLGPHPRGNSQAIPRTLSALTAEFSRQLAQAIREATPAKP